LAKRTNVDAWSTGVKKSLGERYLPIAKLANVLAENSIEFLYSVSKAEDDFKTMAILMAKGASLTPPLGRWRLLPVDCFVPLNTLRTEKQHSSLILVFSYGYRTTQKQDGQTVSGNFF